VLAADSLQGRFLNYFGLGVWGVNATLDLLVRSKEEKFTGGHANREFSDDLYRQLTQLAFDAHMRSLVLRGFAPTATPAPAPAATPTQASRSSGAGGN